MWRSRSGLQIRLWSLKNVSARSNQQSLHKNWRELKQVKCVEVVRNEVHHRCGALTGRAVKVRESRISPPGFPEGRVRAYG